ncbi:Hydroxysteroid dehydrogenase-like protein 2 [Myotis brandtii]|uniref:Hydroxysteroid dehydrogenase-like protein 2 n=1 Tax=Myotis brandtii TaxID=109478 RepID=S7MJR7_MYOBR|nr:Hydroxysteroid dehydrogenase-like protein 2 [Myotis brandtii]
MRRKGQPVTTHSLPLLSPPIPNCSESHVTQYRLDILSAALEAREAPTTTAVLTSHQSGFWLGSSCFEHLPPWWKLAGCTVFITGASRGIGKAIALKAAKDGANIVIAAKTTQAHPKLPGTIYTAAEEIEAAGGKALPCIVDVRDEQQISNAVEKAVEKFGGIDVLVNNASAISLTNTLETPTKRVDLMMNVNTRGTYLTSKACIPHLKKSKIAHILNLSPPLNLNPLWFKQHCAYTIAKYGMSMCVLGMAEEFKGEIAVNALWPKTAIHTAAMDMLGGSGIESQCRKVDIIADAAYSIFKKPKSFTGNFIIDENILKEEGIKDFDVYAIKPGHPLLPDFFLDEYPDTVTKKMESHGLTWGLLLPPLLKNYSLQHAEMPRSFPSPSISCALGGCSSQDEPPVGPRLLSASLVFGSCEIGLKYGGTLAGAGTKLKEELQPPSKPPSGAVKETFKIVKASLSDDLVKATQAIYQFELSGEDGGTWFLDLKNKGGNAGYGEPSEQADVVMNMSTDDFVKMFSAWPVRKVAKEEPEPELGAVPLQLIPAPLRLLPPLLPLLSSTAAEVGQARRGKMKPTMAFMSGKLKIKGNMALAIKLEKLMSQMQAKL